MIKIFEKCLSKIIKNEESCDASPNKIDFKSWAIWDTCSKQHILSHSNPLEIQNFWNM